MPITQKVITINEFGLQERQRTSASGVTKSRFTVKIDATPISHVIDTHELGRRPAEAIADHLRMRIRNIQEEASPSTQVARGNALRGVQRGEDWALKRYSGGRMGTMMPGNVAGGRLFNDSGRLASGLRARKGDRDEWVVNVPAARLNPETLGGGRAALERIYARLVKLIPELGNPRELMQVGTVRESILESYKSILRRNADLRAKLSRQRLAVLGSVLRAFI